jgi:NADH-quinone oxidoreductase subunit I
MPSRSKRFFLWLDDIWIATITVIQGMVVTLRYFLATYRRNRWEKDYGFTGGGTFTHIFEYPERPVPVKPRYRGFHRFDLTTCIACDACARACPVDCIYIDKERSPVGKGFRVVGFTIDYTKCMFCGLCTYPCPVECIYMGQTHDLSCYSRDGCIVDFAKLPLQVGWGYATLNPTVVAQSKTLTKPVWTKPAETAKT